MTRTTPPPTPKRNRLRAAAALIPNIESGLDDNKLSEDKARQMIRFCEWANTTQANDPDEIDLKSVVADGVLRLNARLKVAAPMAES